MSRPHSELNEAFRPITVWLDVPIHLHNEKQAYFQLKQRDAFAQSLHATKIVVETHCGVHLTVSQS